MVVAAVLPLVVTVAAVVVIVLGQPRLVAGTAQPSGDDGQSPTVVQEPDFAAVFERVSSGVVPVTAVVCDGAGRGTGFLIDPRTVVTAAHVVEGAVAVSVQIDGRPMTAEVTGSDADVDLAVLEVGRDAAGSVLRLAETDPASGTEVAALGFPRGTPLRMTEGAVVDVSRVENVEGNVMVGLVEADLSTQPGNSGGPLVDADGVVVGVVVAGAEGGRGSTFAVQPSVFAPLLRDPSSITGPDEAHCDEPPQGPEDESVAGYPDTDDAGQVASTIADYFGGINSGDYETAYNQLSPRLQGGSGPEAFADGVSTSYDFGFDVRDADFQGDLVYVWLEFISLQDPAYGPEGESCTMWSLDYTFIRASDGRFLIDRVRGHGGASGHRPCD